MYSIEKYNTIEQHEVNLSHQKLLPSSSHPNHIQIARVFYQVYVYLCVQFTLHECNRTRVVIELAHRCAQNIYGRLEADGTTNTSTV